MPFVQNAMGSGIGITDYRGSCAVNTRAKRDAELKNDGELRTYLQNNAVEAKIKQIGHVPPAPYFDITGCVTTTNPPIEK